MAGAKRNGPITFSSLTLYKTESTHFIRAAERGEQDWQFAPGPQGLRGLIIEDVNILTAGNALVKVK